MCAPGAIFVDGEPRTAAVIARKPDAHCSTVIGAEPGIDGDEKSKCCVSRGAGPGIEGDELLGALLAVSATAMRQSSMAAFK